MDIILQVCALLYLSLVTLIFLKQKKLNRIENSVYKGIIALNYIELFFDIGYRIANYYIPNSFFAIFLTRMFLCASISWAFGYASYVYVLSSPKNTGEEAIPELRKYFIKRFMIVIAFMLLADLVIFLLPLTITPYHNTLILGGWALYFTNVAIGLTMLVNLITMLRYRQSIKDKKFTSVWVLSSLMIIGFIISIIFPYISVNVTIVTIVTIITYFTLENPDLELINNLNIATYQAESANRAKTDFLSSMSHEIRTPLNAIIGFSKALAKEDISGSAKEEVTDILNSSNNLLEIVNGILDISKLEANKIEIVNKDYSTKEMINELVSFTNTRIGSKQIELKIEVDENIPPVLYGDSNRTKQVISNLLSNAAKYTKEGYILFQVKSEINIDEVKLIFKIEDTGIGMSEEDQINIYTKFQRFDIEKNVNIAGTGLGMAITKGLVDLMNGKITLNSTYGKGTTFIVELTQQLSTKRLEEVVKHDVVEKVTPFNANGARVLVVDDNKINLKVAKKMLTEYNLEIDLIDNGSDCIEKIKSGNNYEIIFLDIMMPVMKGPEVLEKLKTIDNFNTPVIALTADIISGLEEKYTSQGFHDCLSKPIDEEGLFCVLKKYLLSQEEVIQTTDSVPTNNQFNTNILESSGIDVQSRILTLGNIDVYNQKLIEFQEKLETTIYLLYEYMNNREFDKYYENIIELKRMSEILGFTEFTSVLKEHEIALSEHNVELIIGKYPRLKLESLKIDDLLKKYLGR